MRAWLVALAVVALVLVQWFRPIPHPVVTAAGPSAVTVPGARPAIPWPAGGQAALAVEGVGLVGTSGPVDQPQPIASLTKIMTAYLILKRHPLGPGASGPSVTLTAADQSLYQAELKAGQSVTKVVAGEQLTERQMLEALLLPSANNIARVLARWDAGSEAAFVRQMNAMAKQLGMTHTHYADASGANPATVSTAPDQVRLALAAMQIPTFREIVAMPQATLPVAGTVYNVNYYLGKSGIVGVKTGTTAEAGGCYVSAAWRNAGSHRVLVIAAVLGQGGLQPLFTALRAGRDLLNAAGSFLVTAPVLQAGTPVATIKAPWAAPLTVTLPRTVSVVGWPGLTGRIHLVPYALGPSVRAGQTVGILHVDVGDQHLAVPLRAPSALPPPSPRWRLTRL
ncbi:MAG: D-alanyl-D-alanine carboxypeptidase [Actinomycetia bacterium]|nr:D-alanyl-D-alanine carboxypeptidase [Actinomycetes bacterium]